MARKTLSDDKGKKYEVEVPDDDEEEDDENTIYLDEEDVEWLRRKRREESESQRQNSSSTAQGVKTSGKVVKIRAKQASTDSQSTTSASGSRRRTLRLA